jgi:hypothetical protein
VISWHKRGVLERERERARVVVEQWMQIGGRTEVTEGASETIKAE